MPTNNHSPSAQQRRIIELEQMQAEYNALLNYICYITKGGEFRVYNDVMAKIVLTGIRTEIKVDEHGQKYLSITKLPPPPENKIITLKA